MMTSVEALSELQRIGRAFSVLASLEKVIGAISLAPVSTQGATQGLTLPINADQTFYLYSVAGTTVDILVVG